MAYAALSGDAARVVINAAQSFESLQKLRQQESGLKGSMHWKQINGKTYLYRGFTGGKNKCIGPRTEETETLKQKFEQQKQQIKSNIQGLQEQMRIQAGYIKANRLNRFPLAAARMIRALQVHDIPHRVIGTNSLFAYEMAAGVVFDVMLDSRQGIKIASTINSQTILSILQKAVPDLTRVTETAHEYSAVSADGYMIDLVTQSLNPMKPNEFSKLLSKEDLLPVEIESLKWLASAPAFKAVCFDTRGFPVQLETVDPRAFALHKWFVAQQPDRNPLKKQRDRMQAVVVADLVRSQLPHLPLGKGVERIFPADVLQMKNDMDQFSF